MRRIGRSIGWWKVVRVAAATAVIIVGPGISPAVAGNHVGAVSVFASAPAPGHPLGRDVYRDPVLGRSGQDLDPAPGRQASAARPPPAASWEDHPGTRQP